MNVRYFSLIYLCINMLLQSPCLNAMDFQKYSGPKTIIENVENIVPDVTKPLSIACTCNGLAVLEETSCKLFNEVTQECVLVQEISVQGNANRLFHMAVNQPGTKVALMSNQFLRVGNTMPVGEEWQKSITLGGVFQILFDPQDSAAVICYNKGGRFYRMFQNGSSSIKLSDVSLAANRLFAIHPTERQIIYGGDTCEFHMADYSCAGYSYANYRNHTYAISGHIPQNYHVIGQEYNYDGSLVALIANDSLQTLVLFFNPDDLSSSYIQSQKNCVSVAFHPNNEIIFLLSKNNFIQSWDYKAQQCIYEFHFSDLNDIEEMPYLQKRLALSFCGRFLNIALQDRCARVLLPYEIFYGKKATQQLLSTVWALQNPDLGLPQEIVHEIIKKLMDVLVRK